MALDDARRRLDQSSAVVAQRSANAVEQQRRDPFTAALARRIDEAASEFFAAGHRQHLDGQIVQSRGYSIHVESRTATMRVPARFETVEQDSIVWRVLYVRPDGMWHDTGWSDYQAGPIQRTLLDTRLVIPRLLEVLAEVASTQGASAPSTSHPDEVVERFEDLLVACLNRPPSDWGPMRKLSPDEQADADAEARIEKTALLASVSSALAALRSRPEHRGGWVQTRGGSSGIWSLLPLHSERPRRALFSSFREPLPASFAGWELRRSALNQPDLSIAIGASQHACSGMFDGTIDQLIDVAQLDFTPRGESYYQGRIDRGSMDVIRLLMQILQVAQEVLATR